MIHRRRVMGRGLESAARETFSWVKKIFRDLLTNTVITRYKV